VPALLVSAAVIWTFTTITAHQDRGVPPFQIAAPRAGGLSEDGLKAYDWISRSLPADAVILANGYTEGALGMLSRRTGLLDGRTPFAQPDPWRTEAIDWLEQSRRFFAHPISEPVPGRASYVLAARRGVNLGGSYFPTDFRALARDPGLEPVHDFGRVTLYRARGARPEPIRSFGQSGGASGAAVHRVRPTPRWNGPRTSAPKLVSGHTESQPSC
jgi:hypothetical protein